MTSQPTLDLGDASAPQAGPRVVRLGPGALLAKVPGRLRRSLGVAAVVAVTASLCSGAGPLPSPGSSRLDLVPAAQQLDRSPAPARNADRAGIPAARQVAPLARGTAPAVVPVALVPVPVVTPEASALTADGVPEAALVAYRRAAASLAEADPGCRLDWSLLAAIGRVESNHGQFGGRVPAADGAVLPPILGLVLDGRPGTSTIRDTDAGRLDGDTTFDRAVGPMQFIPGTWARWGADGDEDGVVDPHDLDDAALGAGRYLCAGDRDVSTAEGRAAAVFSYNHSDAYVALVSALADAYAAGVPFTGLPPAAVPVPDGPVDPAGDPASVSPPVAPPSAPPAPTEPSPTTEPPSTTAPPTDPPATPTDPTTPPETPTDPPSPDPTCESPAPTDPPSPTEPPPPTDQPPTPTCPDETEPPTEPGETTPVPTTPPTTPAPVDPPPSP